MVGAERSKETSMDNKQIAEASSSHRLSGVYDRLAEDVRWMLPGHATIDGRDNVVAACDAVGR